MNFILRNKYLFFSKILKVTSFVQLFANKMLISINKKTRCEDFNLLKKGYIISIQASQKYFKTEVPKDKISKMVSGIEVIQ